VKLYQAAELAEPGRYRTDLADAHSSLGTTLNRLGHNDAALTATTEAAAHYRVLTSIDPAKYRSRLAHTLAALSGILLDLGRLDEAQDTRLEADFYGHAG
jgi:tetratricopeptide (TPR) repeat protein